MSRRNRLAGLAVGLAAIAVSFGLTGCGAATPPAAIAVDDGTMIVDVRTPAEYASGHLQGAVNLDFQSGSFEEAVADLDTEADYVVYCQSGNRSAKAVSVMEAADLAVQDAGGIDDAAAATGLPVVR